MRIFSYCLLLLTLGTSCRGIRNLLLDKDGGGKDQSGIVFVVGGDYQKTSAVRLFVDSQKITDRPLKPLAGKIQLTVGKQVCSSDITLHRRNKIEKLTCRDQSPNDELKNSFADKLYFFPYGNYCQLGRLVNETTQRYQVEFCGQTVIDGKFNRCVVCQDCEVKTTDIDKGNFDLKKASYPFDIFAAVQLNYRVEVKGDEQSSWRGKTVTFNGNGVLFSADRESCLFGDGCQVRISSDGQCLTPKPLN